MRKFAIAAMAFIVTFGAIVLLTSSPASQEMIYLEPTQSEYVAKVSLASGVRVRLLVLKHCPDSIANTDSNQAIQAANLAASRGLTIRDIGNYHINKQGRVSKKVVWGAKYSYNDLEGLKQFISDQMSVDAERGDTLVIYTIGHGGGDGSIMRLGQRAGLMKIISEAALENEQETLWWQLSCHAAAKLPDVTTLPEAEQEFFSMTASSPANQLSYFCTQGDQMQKVFVALAERDSRLDANGDDIITAGELSRFLNVAVYNGRGKLVYARNEEEPIFGWWDWANEIPIRDNGRGIGEFPDDFVPHPKRPFPLRR